MTIRHEQDFYLWTQQQANALKAGNLADIDMPHLAEEIESMGSSEKRELGNRLSVLLAHLLIPCAREIVRLDCPQRAHCRVANCLCENDHTAQFAPCIASRWEQSNPDNFPRARYKWQYQPVRRGNSWRLTIQNQRDDIQDLLEDSPSLKQEMRNRLEKAYIRARRMASLEIGLAENAFPKECPFALDEMILNPDFWPT